MTQPHFRNALCAAALLGLSAALGASDRADPLAAVPPLPLAGLGAGAEGTYSVAGHGGTYSRPAGAGQSVASFTLAGPLIEDSIGVQCGMARRALNLDSADFAARREAYRCRFTHQGRAIPARFELQTQKPGKAATLLPPAQRGSIALDRVILEIEYRPGSDQGRTYRFSHQGKVMGALDLAGDPGLRIAPASDVSTRRAIVAASVALRLLDTAARE